MIKPSDFLHKGASHFTLKKKQPLVSVTSKPEVAKLMKKYVEPNILGIHVK